ncbi:MAG: hypothetical protein CMJ81_23415 [Planctomycetaceae bacterium]|jgi:protein SCO1/2|nr:hypothetical protein [Planctomycetaceae bacterium]
MFDKIIIKLAFPAVVATFIGVPLVAWMYDGWYSEARYPVGTKVFTLYWSGEKGVTQERINGWNYWQPKFDTLKPGDLKVHEGDQVVFRLISSDVHHGFSMPAFGIGTVDTIFIKPGDVKSVWFIADKVGTFKFFCTIMCGDKEVHDKMAADLTVLPVNATADVPARQPPNLGGLSLTRSNGEQFDLANLHGEVWLASFFFTSCPSGCLKMNQEIAKLQQEFEGQDVKFVSITCDPKTDTPEILKVYSDSFNADADRWVFLTGDLERILHIGSVAFELPIAQKTHSTHLVLVDRQGMIRNTYKASDPWQIVRLKKQLVKVLAEGSEETGMPPVVPVSAQNQSSDSRKL